MSSPSVPATMKPTLGLTYFALASAMACRVYRAILLGHITEPQVNQIVRISSAFRVAPTTTTTTTTTNTTNTNSNNHHHHPNSHTYDDYEVGEENSFDTSIKPGNERSVLSPDLKINAAVEKSTGVESDVEYTFRESSSIGDDVPGYDASCRV